MQVTSEVFAQKEWLSGFNTERGKNGGHWLKQRKKQQAQEKWNVMVD